jgi:glycosyltransferase involved in cell wall biosynthesis
MVYTLSYVITTFNKLPYLKEVMAQLLQNRKEDEEIVVTDGGSTDGTVEYLTELFGKDLIHQYVSGKDFGEAHGFNKGMLLARGSLIKLLSDDDIFDYEVIGSCRSYMLANPGIDIMIANICSFNSTKKPSDLIFVKSYEVWFKDWVNKNTKNCFFCCLPIIIRRTSLSYIGLLDPSFRHVDFEYAVRVTSKKHTKIAFSSDIMVAAFLNSKSVSQNFGGMVQGEIDRVSMYYDYTYPLGAVKPEFKGAQLIKKAFRMLGFGGEISGQTYKV